MIENYGAKYLNCLTDFLTKINIQHNIIDIKSIFKKFFSYLRTDNNKFISFNLPITYEDIYTNDSIININYYNKSKKQLSVTTNKKRTTIQQITNNTKINKTKTAQTRAKGGTDNIPGGWCHLAHLHQVYMC